MNEVRAIDESGSDGESIAPDQKVLFESLLIAYDEGLARGDAHTPDENLVPPELRPRLRAALACLSRLAKPRRGAPTLPEEKTLPATGAAATLPDRIGRFHLLRELGRGGHGIVFLAVDPRLGRLVALKIPRPEALITTELHRRFLREARAASALSHPNLVPIHEAGDEGPFSYIAAAYCEGPTLASWLKQQTSALPFREAAGLIAVLADAVAHAHARGILHRDIKPANVLLAPDDDARSPGATTLLGAAVAPRLTDFGLARLADDDVGERTRTGTALGTPAYMASEQADGRTDEIGPPVDVYALGVILYELLVGHPPFRGANDLETLRLVSAGEIVPPSRLRGDTPRDLEAICLRALEHKPSQRYATAAALADDLRRFIDGRPTHARPLGKFGHAVRWIRRRPMRAALVGVSLLALITIAGGGWWYSAQLTTALTIAREARLHSEVLRSAANTRSAWQAFSSHHAAHAKSLLRSAAAGPTDSDRSFAWQLLWQRLHDERLTLAGHEASVFAVACSPDGLKVASASKDRSVRIWDAVRGNCLAVLTGHKEEVNMVVWSPDGRLLASADDDGAVHLWNAVRPGPLGLALRESHGPAVSLMFSPDSSLLARGYDDGTLILTDTADWQTRERIVTGTSRVEMLAFSPDGGLLASANGHSGVQVWNIVESRPESLRSLHKLRAFDVAFDRESRLAACGEEWATIWDVHSDKVLLHMPLPSEHVQSLAFCLDDHYLALARRDGAVQLYHVPDAARGPTLLGHTDRIWCLVPSADGRWLATASADKTVKLWGLTGSKAETTWQRPTRVDALAFTPDGNSLLAATENGDLTSWQVSQALERSGPPIKPAPASNEPTFGAAAWQQPHRLSQPGEIVGSVQAIAISPDGRLAATCSTGDAGPRLWNLQKCAADGGPLLGLEPERVPLTSSVAFSRDGELLAQASDASVFIWHVATRRLLDVLGEHGESVRSLAFSPDGERLAVASGGEIALWNHRAARRVKTWKAHAAQINTLAYSIDGRRLASGGHDRLVKLWDAESGADLVVLSGHLEAIRDLAFSPDGRLLATAGDATVRLWSLSTFDELASIDDFKGSIRALAFHPRAMILALGGFSADQRGELRLWCGPPDARWRAGF